MLVLGISPSVGRHNEKSPSKAKVAQKYGQFMYWKQVSPIFPKYARATIIDFETGKSFQVQRRGGQKHADVQPLTAADSTIMKTIYQGKWSWKRRAVVMKLEDGTRIAASMAGMPHGQGAIRGNNFNGHFCLHFRDSKTHGSGKVDLAHQMMIWKAANILNAKLAGLSPREVIVAFLTAINQSDKGIAGKLIYPGEKSNITLQPMSKIDSIRLDSIKQVSARQYQVQVHVQYEGDKREAKKKTLITLIPNKKGWLIEADSVKHLLDGQPTREYSPN